MPITIDLRENALVKDLIAEVQAETEVYRQLAKEQRRQIEEQRQQAEEQRQQAEEQRQHTRAAILNLYQTLHLEPTLIATIFEISEQEVLGILEAAE
ncbi:hypothetical protein [Haliscomenobacter hydrossis]|uniref:Uncharacterized protein n=1 Tax=Haliscomenobacter hydrossis (strain ATCC 27775 / DSM 1100 / LMG 10767 / O) TaxID=760192 RepID=F4L358_HALH1|nr:hypothetical protein [Haliscomenobacter hydrossis]AEE50717.1 hypothetical protein Halhy_2852 [Haliscomenobacter hydrossis DSM 1100]AEE50720.1 hypothetical protein Halhy_2855 [Haliscomenobacter hydrossis DSM 1100]